MLYASCSKQQNSFSAELLSIAVTRYYVIVSVKCFDPVGWVTGKTRNLARALPTYVCFRATFDRPGLTRSDLWKNRPDKQEPEVVVLEVILLLQLSV